VRGRILVLLVGEPLLTHRPVTAPTTAGPAEGRERRQACRPFRAGMSHTITAPRITRRAMLGTDAMPTI
jgi:hypothetical protein